MALVHQKFSIFKIDDTVESKRKYSCTQEISAKSVILCRLVDRDILAKLRI